MKGNLSYLPAEREIASVDDIYREEPANDPYMVTSIKIRTSLRNRIKAAAGIKGIRMQDLVAKALAEYLDRHE